MRLWLLSAWIILLAGSWADSMFHHTKTAFDQGKISAIISQSGGLMDFAFVISNYPTSSDSGTSWQQKFIPVTQDTLFPRPLAQHYTTQCGDLNHYQVVFPYWLLISISLFLGVFVPGAWRRWHEPYSGHLLLRWSFCWLAFSAVLALSARAWVLKTPRFIQTSRFTLIGTPEGAIAGKIAGVVQHRDGSSYPFLSLHGMNTGSAPETDSLGKFEERASYYERNQILFKIGGDPVYIVCDPERPLFWRIREKGISSSEMP